MGAHFKTTRWTLVLNAAEEESPRSREALEELCRTYWYPVYAFIRRRVHTTEDAQDLTQSYFTNLLEKGYLRQVKPTAGRFRSFLLASVKNFLANEYDRAKALKRGGDQPHFSLDAAEAERRFQVASESELNPEQTFERRWAIAVADQAMNLLGEDFAGRAKSVLFAAIKPLLAGSSQEPSYRESAEALGMSEGAFKVAVLRARRAYGDKLREVVRDTVTEPSEVENELRHLIQLLAP